MIMKIKAVCVQLGQENGENGLQGIFSSLAMLCL